MRKLFILFTIISVAIVSGADVFKQREKVTQLQLYVQDILTGPNPTNIRVASAASTFASPTFFGLVAVIDDPVRIRPSPHSEIMGRAQGLFAHSSLEETSIHMTFDIVFTKGEYNGSTLNLAGHNPYPRGYREMSVIGGTGAFRLARGFVEVTTVAVRGLSSGPFFQYNITVLHY